MTFNDLVLLIAEPSSPTDVAGKAFFSSEISQNDKREFVQYLLSNKRYYQLSEIMEGCTLAQTYSASDFIKEKSAEKSSIESRYFDLLLLVCKELSVDEKELIPMLFVTATAQNGTLLRAWFAPSKTYLLRLAYADYDLVFNYIFLYDIKFNFLDVLITVDKIKTIALLVDMVLDAKTVNKGDLRMFLRNFKNDTLARIQDIYPTLEFLQRESAVKLLLLFKNDNIVSNYLNELALSEESVSIKILIQEDLQQQQLAPKCSGATEFFFNAMVNGTEFSVAEFNKLLKNEHNEKVASRLFFSVYNNNLFSMIVIIDGGKILDLNNKEAWLDEGSFLRVMHPCELTSKYAYLKNMNIEQPFNQLNRKVYKLDDYKFDNIYTQLKGTLIAGIDLKDNMKASGFKALSQDNNCQTRELGLIKEGILCALSITPTDFNLVSGNLVKAESVTFYSMTDVIRLNGQIYVDGVPFYPISGLSPRLFSEFLHNTYELLGCISGQN